MRLKIYPKVSRDTAIKMVFDDYGRHYTIRLAGSPLLITEQLYKNLGGETFLESYYKFIENNLSDEWELEKLNEATRLTKLFINTLIWIWDRGRSPIVVYADDYIDR